MDESAIFVVPKDRNLKAATLENAKEINKEQKERRKKEVTTPDLTRSYCDPLTPPKTNMAKAGLAVFDSTQETWDTYVDRFEIYCSVSDVTEDKQPKVLLNMMGAKTYRLLQSLVAPNKPATLTYAEVVTTLRTHLDPAPLVVAERFTFNNRRQGKDETVKQYLGELRRLSETCNYGDMLADLIRDRLICGLRNERTQQYLLTQTDLTLDSALKTALAHESATRTATNFQHQPQEREVETHQLVQKPVPQKGARCYRCDKTGHSPDTCWFRKKPCQKCGHLGHVAKVCRGGARNQRTNKTPNTKGKAKLHKVLEDSSTSEDEMPPTDLDSLRLNEITANTDRETIWVRLDIEHQNIEMELDTGSALTIVNEQDYQRHWPHLPLKRANLTLRTYTGQKVYPKGKIRVTVTYRKKSYPDMYVYVLPKGGAPLLGREWMRKLQLDWRSIQALTPGETEGTTSSPTRLADILAESADVFQDGLGLLKGISATIEVDTQATPKYFKARPVPYAIRPAVEAELDNLERAGVLSRVDHSDWATPVVPVMKKSPPNTPPELQRIRLCGDFKVTLNPVLKPVQYPLPRIDDIFASLTNGKRFSKIDLAQAYLQMEVEGNSRQYLTINTHKGLYQYNRLVFGVASAPAIWQKAMDQILQGIPGVQCYLDDILITGETEDTHLANLRQVLQRLAQFGLRAKKEKCDFFKPSVEYCGHIIDENGLHKSPEKVAAVVRAPAPENVTQLRSFLGLVNYYHKFLPQLATIVHPLNGLLKAGAQWQWTKQCQTAFQKCKTLITSEKVLAHYNPDLPLRLACDASPYGIGAVLSHQCCDGLERPVAFASRALTTAEKNYAQIDREALSLVWGVKKFNQYLHGRRFTLITDHQPLTSIFNPAKSVPVMSAQRLQRWALFLGAHQYDILFKGTKQHGNADGLSRLPLPSPDSHATDPVDLFHTALIDPLPVTNADIVRHTRNDPTLARAYELTVTGWPKHGDPSIPTYSARREQLSVCRGTLMCGTRVVIPPKLQPAVLEQLHEGHVGIVKMKNLARSFVWWPEMDHQIEEVAKRCTGCQLVQNAPAPVTLHPWEWPSSPWQRVHVDFAGPFLDTMFLVAVDAHSKWPEVVPMSTTTADKTITTLRTIFARNGLPEQICSDNGPQFTSEEFKAFLKSNGVKHYTSAPYHPSTNGLAERFVQTLKKGLKAMKDDPAKIQHKVDRLLLAYRNAPHTTTGQPPAVLMLNRRLRSKIDLLKPNVRRDVENKQYQQVHDHAGKDTRQFHIGQPVLARAYRSDVKWQPATVCDRQGPLTYQVKVGERTIRRHTDQLLQRPHHDTPQTAAASSQTEADTTVQDDTIENETTTGTDDTEAPASRSTPVSKSPQPTRSTPDNGSPQPGRRYPTRLRKPTKRWNV